MKHVSSGDQQVETSDILASAIVRAAAIATVAHLTETLSVPTADEYGQATELPLAVGISRDVTVTTAPDDALEYAWPTVLPPTAWLA